MKHSYTHNSLVESRHKPQSKDRKLGRNAVNVMEIEDLVDIWKRACNEVGVRLGVKCFDPPVAVFHWYSAWRAHRVELDSMTREQDGRGNCMKRFVVSTSSRLPGTFHPTSDLAEPLDTHFPTLSLHPVRIYRVLLAHIRFYQMLLDFTVLFLI